MRRNIILTLAAAALITGPVATASVAQTDMSRFPLIKAVPNDAFVVVAARQNPERKFLDAYWAEVASAFNQSGFIEEVWDIVTDSVPDDKLDVMDQMREQFSQLLSEVNWNELFTREMVHASRFKTQENSSFVYEGIFISRLEKEAAKKNYMALGAILRQIETFVESQTGDEEAFAVTETKSHGADVTTLSPSNMPSVGIAVAVRGDIVTISFGMTSILQDSLDLLSDKGEGLAATPRFKAALKQMPPAEDTIFFFDADRLFNLFQGLGNAVKNAAAMAGNAADQQASPSSKLFEGITQVLEDVSIVDYVASVEWTDGNQVYTDTVTVMKDEAKASPLHKIFCNKTKIQDFAKYIPEDAQEFSVSGDVDLVALYDYAISFVKKSLPQGDSYVELFENLQKEQWNLNIRNDIFALFTGGHTVVKIGDEWIFLLKVTDEKKVTALVDRALNAINAQLAQAQPLMVSTINVSGHAGFKRISHGLFVMAQLQPIVLGCADGYFIVGSSDTMVEKCLNTAAGKLPNITKSKRWRAEALVPEGAVKSVFFRDESETAAECQAMLAQISMSLSMASMITGGQSPGITKLASILPPLLNKLQPVAAKMDFYKSSARYSTFDGKIWLTHEVQNYKTPKERKKTSAPTTSATTPLLPK